MQQNPANLPSQPNAQNPQQQPPAPKKKVREGYTLKAEHFQQKNGLQSLYKTITQLNLTKAQDNVDATMKQIVNTLKTWNFQLLPRYSFEYFLQRCKALGNQKFTQAYMAKVRKIHKGEDTWGTQTNQQKDPVEMANLDHLNPNGNVQESLDQKVERVMKLAGDIGIYGSQVQKNGKDEQFQNQKMQIENLPVQDHYAEDDEDEFEEDQDFKSLMQQMNQFKKEKAQLLSKGKQEENGNNQHEKKSKTTPGQNEEKKKENENNYSESQEIPYVPDGYEDVEYGQDESYND